MGDNEIKLQTDENGDIVTSPVMGWMTRTVGEIAVLLAVQYAETPEQLETGGRQLQFVLTPQQCLELAETLKRAARMVLDQGSGGTRH